MFRHPALITCFKRLQRFWDIFHFHPDMEKVKVFQNKLGERKGRTDNNSPQKLFCRKIPDHHILHICESHYFFLKCLRRHDNELLLISCLDLLSFQNPAFFLPYLLYMFSLIFWKPAIYKTWQFCSYTDSCKIRTGLS